jgi:predicted porin
MTADTTMLNLIELPWPVLAACGVPLAAAFLVPGIVPGVTFRIVSWMLAHVRGVRAVSSYACGFLIMTCLYMTPCALAQSATPNQTLPTVITCTSTKGQRQVCKADTAAGVALLRSTGESNCLLGNTWGYDSAGVWVSDGCGGDFALGGTKESSGADNFIGTFEAYGQLRTHLASFRDDLEVQDNATRVGMNFATRGAIKMFAGTEWGVNLVQSETQFNLSAGGPGEFGTVASTTNPVFLARLGFVGVDFGPLGKIAIGKQYAVHYDIAGYTTDRFNVFGGQGTHAYVAGTDGGETGTGRADRIVNYRNTLLKVVDVGVQGQFRGAGDDTTTDGVGGSLQFKILPGVKAGGTYTRTNWSPAKQQIRGLGGNSDYMAVGTRIDWRILEFGAVYSRQHNGDVAFVTAPTGQTTPIVFDAEGAEVYTRINVGRFAVIGGYTLQDPKVRDPLLNPNFKTSYFILGAEWFFAKNGKVYSESRIDVDSTTAAGEPGYNVFTIGFRYDFSWRTSHQP